jgi:hypothetical protein
MTSRKKTKRINLNNDIPKIKEINKNKKDNKSFYQTKTFQDYAYSLAKSGFSITALSNLVQLSEACTCNDKKDTWPYNEFMKSGFKEIFDKIGHFCRNTG